jgi:hypothetical protein
VAIDPPGGPFITLTEYQARALAPALTRLLAGK